MERATFAAGCFWGVQDIFMKSRVISSMVGYIGGHTPNPTYRLVCTGSTGHAEAVQVEYNPQEISFDDLLDIFWKIHDPTTLNRQGPDFGSQYRSAIFYYSEQQKLKALDSKSRYQKFFRDPIVTEVVSATEFYPAEEYHQQYFMKNGMTGCHRPINKF